MKNYLLISTLLLTFSFSIAPSAVAQKDTTNVDAVLDVLDTFLPGISNEFRTAYERFLTKEQQRANWFTQSKFQNYQNFDVQYRIKAFKKLIEKYKYAEKQEWQSLGPHEISGRVLSLAIDPTDEQTIWVGSASGGLFKSEDSGNNWRHSSNGLPSMAVTSVVIHPVHSDTMFIGTGAATGLISFGVNATSGRGAGMFLSVDGGENWVEAGDSLSRPVDNWGHPVNVNELAWHTNRPDSLFMASSSGLWRYLLSENTWEMAFNDSASMHANVQSVIINEREPGVIYAALENDGILKSLDHGDTWKPYNNGLPQFSNGSPADSTVKMLTQSTFYPQVLYVDIVDTTHNSTVFKSVNGGEHWMEVGKAPQFLQELAVSPYDPDLLIGGGIKLFRSTDGGQEWSDLNLLQPCFNVIHVDQHGAVFSKSNPDLMYAVNDGGVYRSRNRGVCWESANQGLSTLQVYGLASSSLDSVSLAMGVQDQGTLSTSDQGMAWTKRVGGDGGMAVYNSKTQKVLYATGPFGNHWRVVSGEDPVTIRKGILGGKQKTGKDALWMAPLAMNHHSPNILYTATLKHLYRTVNAGSHWTRVARIDTVSIITTDIKNPNIVYAYSRSGDMWRSEQQGQDGTWKKLSCDHPSKCLGKGVFDLEADPDDKGVLYATKTTLKDQIWRSNDHGQNWENITTDDYDSLALPVQSIVITPKAITGTKQIYIGTDLGVFMRRSTEKQWTFMGGDVPYAIVTAMHFNPIDQTIRVGTFGRGAWKMKVPLDSKMLTLGR